MPKKVKVLVVDDSALIRQLIPSMLSRSSLIEVVGTAPNPLVAREMIKALKPDVITLDVEMPKMDGITFLEKIMTLRPTPVVMVSSLTQKGAAVTLQALELGAIDFIGKPTTDLQENMESMSEELISKVLIASEVKVRARLGRATLGSISPLSFSTTETIIAIGASTGGVEALGALLHAMPPNAPGIVVAQHMPPNFTKSLADRLNGTCSVRICEAEEGRRIVPGQVWIAPGGRHLSVARCGADYICHLTDGPNVSGHKPSVDYLFTSVAEACKSAAIGVILTGMGKDGAQGLLAMRNAGASTIGQDEATSLVYGMPKVAFEIGAVERQLPDTKILATIIQLASKRSSAVRI